MFSFRKIHGYFDVFLQKKKFSEFLLNHFIYNHFQLGKPFYQCEETETCETGNNFLENNIQIGSPARSSPSQSSDNGERFSRKVFVGGLPPDIDEGINTIFRFARK